MKNTKVDLFCKLADTCKDLLSSRREIEWRISLTFWTAIVSMTVYLLAAGKNSTNMEWKYWALYIALFLCLLLFVYWHISVNGSNRKDLDLITYFREKVELELGETSVKPERPKNLDHSAFRYAIHRKLHFNCFFPHLIITVILFCASIFLTL